MANTLNITNIPAPRVPFIDDRTGLMSREWYRFFLNLFLLTGSGSNPTTLEELQLGPPNQPDLTELFIQINKDIAPQYEDQSGDFLATLDTAQLMSMMARFENLESAIQGAYLQPPQITITNFVSGPSSATDNAIARFDGSTGQLIQNSVTTIDDTGNASGILSQQFSDGTAVTLAAGKLWYNGTTGSWNGGMGNGNITQQIGEEIFIYGKASAAITDSPLQIVYKTGVVGASGVIQFAPTIASITEADLILGIATEPIAHNGFGRVTTFGIVRAITTNGTAFGEVWADNDDIYYNPVTGNPTKIKPVAPNIKVQLGTIINAGSGGSGSFFVSIGSSSTLGGTDSNVQFGALANNNLIAYDSTAGYWKNATASSIGLGTVTTVGWTGGIVSVATPTTTPAFTIAGTSGGIPYFNSGTTWATTAALAASALVIGGGAGAAPATTTTGTGVVTALGVNTGTAGAFVVNGGALGTPASGTVTNLTGTASININGTVGATTAAAGKFTTLSAIAAQGTIAVQSTTATNSVYAQFTNGGGTSYVGADTSTGSVFSSGAYGFTIFNAANAATTFFTNAVERMRISSTGQVGIGLSPGYQLQLSTDSAAKPGVGGLWTVVSDERIKADIVPANLDRCYEIVKSVPLKYFGFASGVYTDDQINDKHNLGWIAQDVQKVFKNAVSVKPFTPATGNVIKDCLDLNGGQMHAALYGAVQALMEKVEAQAARIAALEAKQ
jgi:hypothetical protein